ncbi:MAG TPA: NAD-dependent epimerase/dehydratase family protein [Pseudonocardiaceae bacterium]
MAAKVVLVTGVSGYLAGRLAARLAEDPDCTRVIGVDTVAPSAEMDARLGRAEFVRADIRNPLIGKLIADAHVDTVVHASLTIRPQGAGGRALQKEMNVIGTMQLLAACQRAPQVRTLVVKSTSAVYGVGPADPAEFTEEMAPTELPTSGYARDLSEVEGYVRGFGRRRPDVSITLLRFCNLIGPGVDNLLTRYFALPGVVPMTFGRDGRLQLLHPEDALAVLYRAATRELPGVFNVGGDGILLLSQAIRRAGRVAVPVPGPVLGNGGRIFRRLHLGDLGPEEVRYLSFGRVLDTTRLKKRFGFTPKWTTRDAFDDYVRGRGLRPVVDPKVVNAAERGMLDLVERFR